MVDGAARLAHRYISERFLPDKAIDLVDEAASGLRLQLDSSPVEVDSLERRALTLEVEQQALQVERDADSKVRLSKIQRELANGELKPLPVARGGERLASVYLVIADPDGAGPGVRRLAEILRATAGNLE